MVNGCQYDKSHISERCSTLSANFILFFDMIAYLALYCAFFNRINVVVETSIYSECNHLLSMKGKVHFELQLINMAFKHIHLCS